MKTLGLVISEVWSSIMYLPIWEIYHFSVSVEDAEKMKKIKNDFNVAF